MAVEATTVENPPTTAESPSKRKAVSSLDRLRAHTQIVVDSAKLSDAQKATDATTNPSLMYKAITCGEYDELVKSVIESTKKSFLSGATEAEKLRLMVEDLMIAFVTKIADAVPGLVSFEVDPEFSFDSKATCERARALIAKFKAAGVDPKRLLVKIAATWEGIQAAKQLEADGIHCNLTLLFSFYQAVACAEAKTYLISPFVGRITDWYQAKSESKITGEADPGVQAVRKIYNYYKRFDIPTIVMGASFRTAEQVKLLAGCDKLTIPPSIIEELDRECGGDLPACLSVERAKEMKDIERISLDEKSFRWHMNEDAMATEKLAEGIRRFNADWNSLKEHLKKSL